MNTRHDFRTSDMSQFLRGVARLLGFRSRPIVFRIPPSAR